MQSDEGDREGNRERKERSEIEDKDGVRNRAIEVMMIYNGVVGQGKIHQRGPKIS